MRVEIDGFRGFSGVHCETVATGTLLDYAGIQLSEPMLFGLGEGLSFIFLNLRALPLPFLGGRVKPFALTERLCSNLDIRLHVAETGSRRKAWQLVEAPLARREPVGLQLDSYFLDYFAEKVHFAGHFVAAYGYDDERVFLVDTQQQGGLQTATRRNVEEARFAKGQMAARARTWTIPRVSEAPDLASAARRAIRSNAAAYLAPAFKGASYFGIRKLAAPLPNWLTLSEDPAKDLPFAATLMERAGTGGALFRNLYRDFLREVQAVLPCDAATLEVGHECFRRAAEQWELVAMLVENAGRSLNGELLREASAACRRIESLETEGMQALVELRSQP